MEKVSRGKNWSSYLVIDTIADVLVNDFEDEEHVSEFIMALIDLGILSEVELEDLLKLVEEGLEKDSAPEEIADVDEPVLESESLIRESSKMKFLARYAGRLCLVDRFIDDGVVLKYGNEEVLVPKEEEAEIELVAGARDFMNIPVTDLAFYEFMKRGIKQLGFDTWEDFRQEALRNPDLVQRALSLVRDIEHGLIDEMVYGKPYRRRKAHEAKDESDGIVGEPLREVVRIYHFDG